VSELYVNIGRRDGAKVQDFRSLLEDKGIERDNIRRVNVRHRHTFITVLSDAREAAQGALLGATIAGKEALVEESRSQR
jgi:hypothetical protein